MKLVTGGSQALFNAHGQQIIGEKLAKDKLKADINLGLLISKGGYDTADASLLDNYKKALTTYEDRKIAEKFGFSDAEYNAFTQANERASNADKITAMEGGGGQMGKYFAQITAGNKQKGLLGFAAEDAKLKLQKQGLTDSSFNNLQETSGTIQNQKNFDLGNYRYDLAKSGQSVSDLRMQMYENEQAMYQSIADAAGGGQGGGNAGINFGGGGGGNNRRSSGVDPNQYPDGDTQNMDFSQYV